jgi:hypothetical protein
LIPVQFSRVIRAIPEKLPHAFVLNGDPVAASQCLCSRCMTGIEYCRTARRPAARGNVIGDETRLKHG